jgi:mannose-6-phosphate isomerase-like protein (cupin superfamily)
MKTFNLKDMYRNWFVGNFEPTAYKTKDFEVGVALHPKDSKWEVHYHKQGTEINLLLKGKMRIQGKEIEENQIFILEPYEVADPIFLEDCTVVVIKTPSVPGDKFVVETK